MHLLGVISSWGGGVGCLQISLGIGLEGSRLGDQPIWQMRLLLQLFWVLLDYGRDA